MRDRVSAEALAAYSASLLESATLPAADAAAIAACLVEANLRGVDSHGVLRLPIYYPRFLGGAMNPVPSIRVVHETPVSALIDGDNGLGHLVGITGMRRAIGLARKAGIALVVARNSNHFGAAGYFSVMAAQAGMIGFACSNTCPAMPAVGSRTAVVGNGPFSIALPAASGPPICLDISTSAGAYGKILLAARAGQPIPDGWAVDSDGLPTNDPHRAIDSQLLLPFAGHKGFGIAFMIDALCAALGDTWLGHDIPNIYEPGKEMCPGRVSHLFIAISADVVGTGPSFGSKTDAMKALVHGALRAPGVDALFYPGEIEWKTRAERLRDGIPLAASVADDLEALGRKAGLTAPWRKGGAT